MGDRFSELYTERETVDSFGISGIDGFETNRAIRESPEFFGWLEGKTRFPLFNCGMLFRVKSRDSVYAQRCAEYIESITAENLREHAALYKCFEALADYVADMLEEHSGEFDLGGMMFDKYSTVEDLIKLIAPAALTFERHDLLSEEESPIAFSLKLFFKPVPDEFMEIALHGNEPIYAGEYRGVSPWNENLSKKKYNYARYL